MRRGYEPSRWGRITAGTLLLAVCWGMLQSASPRAAAQGGLLLEERFDNNAKGWLVDSYMRISGGKMVADITHSPFTSWTVLDNRTEFSDFDVRATYVTNSERDNANGLIWLGFRMASEGTTVIDLSANLYGFGCAPYDQFCRFVRVVHNNADTLAVVRDISSLRSGVGAVNVLRVAARGREFSCYVNDTLVLDIRDESLQGGYFGLGASKFNGSNWSLDIDDLEVRSVRAAPTWTNTVPPTKTSVPTNTPVPTNTKPGPPTATTLPTETPRIIPTSSPTRDRRTRTVGPAVTFTPDPNATAVVLPTPLFHIIGRAYLPRTANRANASVAVAAGLDVAPHDSIRPSFDPRGWWPRLTSPFAGGDKR